MGLFDRLAMLGISRAEVKAELRVLIVQVLADMERERRDADSRKERYKEWLTQGMPTTKLNP